MAITTNKKQPNCVGCGHKLKKVGDNRYAHKKKEHWVDRPHKAVPIWAESTKSAEKEKV